MTDAIQQEEDRIRNQAKRARHKINVLRQIEKKLEALDTTDRNWVVAQFLQAHNSKPTTGGTISSKRGD